MNYNKITNEFVGTGGSKPSFSASYTNPFTVNNVYVNDIIPGNEMNSFFVCGQFGRFNGLNVQPIVKLKYVHNGINEKLIPSILNIYPNPATSIIRFESNIECEIYRIKIIDLQGRILYKENQSENRLNISFLPSGIYIIQVQARSLIASEKLIVN